MPLDTTNVYVEALCYNDPRVTIAAFPNSQFIQAQRLVEALNSALINAVAVSGAAPHPDFERFAVCDANGHEVLDTSGLLRVI